MRRLFSTFASGAPGAGLLLMRLATGGALLFHGLATFSTGLASGAIAYDIACAAMGVLFVVGLWTPIVGAVGAMDAVLHAFLSPVDAAFYALLGTLAASLALLGPGAWSMDARLFGWRRLEISSASGHQKRREPSPKE